MARRRSSKPQTPFAKRLEDIRVSWGIANNQPEITKQDFAALLGLQAATYSTYETGVSHPNVKTLYNLYKLTGVSLDWLVCGVAEKQPPQHKPDPRLRLASHRRQSA